MPVMGYEAQADSGESGHRDADADDLTRVRPVEQVAENGLSESIRQYTNRECPGESEPAPLKFCAHGP